MSFDCLKDKTLLVGMCGSLGLFSMPSYLVTLKTMFKKVNIIMTKSAIEILPDKSLMYFSDHVYTDDTKHNLNHIQIARDHDIYIICPATAHTLGMAAYGLASNLLTTVLLAFSDKPVLFFPNMNLMMWNNPIIKNNIKLLSSFYYVFEPHIQMAYESASKTTKQNIVLPSLDQIMQAILTQYLLKQREI